MLVSPEEMVLEQLIHLFELDNLEEQSRYYCEINNIDADFIDDKDRLALFPYFVYEFNKEKEKVEPIDEIMIDGEKYTIAPDITDIRVGNYIEAINIEQGKELLNAHVVGACLYRKDHSKPFLEEEIIQTATKLLKKDVKIAISSILQLEKLLHLLKERFPILYKSEGNGGYDDSPRKGNDMVALICRTFNYNWNEAKNLKLSEAMVMLETLAYENERSKKNGNR